MDEQLSALHKVLQTYAASVVANLDAMDKEVLRVLTNLEPHDKTRRYQISLVILEMIPQYLRMVNISQSELQRFTKSASELEAHFSPDGDQKEPTPEEAPATDRPNVEETQADPLPSEPEEIETETAREVPHDEGTHTSENHEDQSTTKSGSDEQTEATIEEQETSEDKKSSYLEENIPCSPLRRAEANADDNFDSNQCRDLAPAYIPKHWQYHTGSIAKQCRPRSRRPTTKGKANEPGRAQLPLDKKYVVTHVISPSEFYVQPADTLHLENMERQWGKYDDPDSDYSNRLKHIIDIQSEFGRFCFATFPGYREYLRVEVLEWKADDPEVAVVHLIDYGPTMECSYKNLRKWTESYEKCPRMAAKCHLAGVYSPNPQFGTTWPTASKNFFERLCQVDERGQFEIIFLHEEKDSYAVDLQEIDKPDGPTLGEMLVASGYAHQEQVSDYATDDELEGVDNINELITGYDARDEARICPFTDGSGRCFKGASCRLEHGKLSRDGTTTDTVLAINRTALKDAPLPEVGARVEVLITGYIDTCHFYAQILNRPRKSDLYNDSFQHLLNRMKERKMVATYERFKLNPGLSELVLVKEGQDWYRGSCVGYADDDKIEVFMVDFGYKKTKKLRSLRQMKEEFLYLPAQAVECVLYDCQERRDIDKNASNEFFSNYMHLEVFTGRVVEGGKPLMLKLRGSNGVGMGQVLKDWGLGEDPVHLRIPEDWPISFP